MWTVTFWKSAAERAIKTFAQALISLWTVGEGFDLFAVDWLPALGVSLGAAVLSVLFSLASSGIGTTGSPSLVEEPYGRHAKRD